MKIKRKYAYLASAGIFAAALFAWAFFFWQREIEVFLADVGVYFRDNLRLLEGVPLIVYSLVIFVLPIFFLPVTPIFILASARAETEPMIVILLYCWLGVTANIAVSYFISRKFGDFLRVKLEARGVKIPRLPPYEQYEFVFLMRMIPGNPLAVQNYALGLAGIPFVKYVVVSLPIQYVQIFGYVYLGEGFFTGGFSNMAIAVSFFVILAIVARMLDKRYGHKLRGKNGISKTER